MHIASRNLMLNVRRWRRRFPKGVAPSGQGRKVYVQSAGMFAQPMRNLKHLFMKAFGSVYSVSQFLKGLGTDLLNSGSHRIGS